MQIWYIFFIYCFAIRAKIYKEIEKINNSKLNYIEKIAEILLKNNKEIYDQGIWELFEKYKISNKSYYKQYNSIIQALNMLKNIEIFCLKYNLIEGCSLCTIAKDSIKYLSPFIEIKEIDLQKINILEDIIKNKLTNVQSVCPLCGYNQNNKIISQTYFKIYNKFVAAKFLFITLEFTDEHEGIMKSDDEVELLAFNKRIMYNKEIVEYLLSEKTLFGIKYNLIGVINTPQSNHYNGVVINLNKKYL